MDPGRASWSILIHKDVGCYWEHNLQLLSWCAMNASDYGCYVRRKQDWKKRSEWQLVAHLCSTIGIATFSRPLQPSRMPLTNIPETGQMTGNGKSSILQLWWYSYVYKGPVLIHTGMSEEAVRMANDVRGSARTCLAFSCLFQPTKSSCPPRWGAICVMC